MRFIAMYMLTGALLQLLPFFDGKLLTKGKNIYIYSEVQGKRVSRKPRKKIAKPTPSPSPSPTPSPTPSPNTSPVKEDTVSPSNSYTDPPVSNEGGGAPLATLLNGTYRLNTSRSQDPHEAAQRATRHVPPRKRQRVLDSLTPRLASPEDLAIDRRGRNVTIASSRASRISIEADEQERSERLDNGRTVRIRATLASGQLNISQTGDSDSDYTVTFDPIDNGQRLRVTRRISTEPLSQAVVFESIYDKTSEVARWDVYKGDPNYPPNTTASGEFVVPNGTQLVALLNNNLTTKDSRTYDSFTMTVQSPSQFEGATIEGQISSVQSSNEITGRSSITLSFERIRLRDGRTYRFAGLVDSLIAADGEIAKVDNEGAVQNRMESSSTSAKRTAIGSSIGAIIGAIAGGGKGAAIGSAIGAGAGVGTSSVYINGKDELKLIRGSEVRIISGGPQ